MEKQTLLDTEKIKESNNDDRKLKVVQYTLPLALCNKFKGACYVNGESMKDVIQEMMVRYVETEQAA